MYVVRGARCASVRQCGQILRTSRCPMDMIRPDDSMKGWTPRSMSRIRAEGASFVWSVLSTR